MTSEFEPLYGNLPTVPPVPDSERRGVDGTLDAMDNAVEKTMPNLDFRTHVQQVIEGLGSLFPGNNIVPHAADTVNEYIASSDVPPTISAAELKAQALAATPQINVGDDISPEDHSRQMIGVINHQAHTITGIQNILTHVLCQNVVLGTFNACVTKELDNCVTSFEHAINKNIATVKSAVTGFETDVLLVGRAVDKLAMVPPPMCEASRDIEVRLDSIESLLHRLLAEKESPRHTRGPPAPLCSRVPTMRCSTKSLERLTPSSKRSASPPAQIHPACYPTPFPSLYPGTGKRESPSPPTRCPHPSPNHPEALSTGSHPP